MKFQTPLALLALLILSPLAGCGGDSDPVVMVEADDAEMIAAVEKARASVGDFIAALANPTSDQSGFAVKKEFTQEGRSEFMWLVDVEFSNGVLTGTLDNDPGIVTNVAIGERYTVAASEISDWVYMDGEELVGGYSIAVLMSRQ
jgi:uncharacterized protein YegJ (DUF2314 family)